MISAEVKARESDTSDSESSDEEKMENNPINGELRILSCSARNENVSYMHVCIGKPERKCISPSLKSLILQEELECRDSIVKRNIDLLFRRLPIIRLHLHVSEQDDIRPWKCIRRRSQKWGLRRSYLRNKNCSKV